MPVVHENLEHAGQSSIDTITPPPPTTSSTTMRIELIFLSMISMTASEHERITKQNDFRSTKNYNYSNTHGSLMQINEYERK